MSQPYPSKRKEGREEGKKEKEGRKEGKEGGRGKKSSLAIILYRGNDYKISAPHKLFADMSILE